MDVNGALIPEQGWHCLHLFYRIEFGQWQLLSPEEQSEAKTRLSSLVQEVRALESTQLLTLSVVTPKADLGFMLITPDLHVGQPDREATQSRRLGPTCSCRFTVIFRSPKRASTRTTAEEYARTLETGAETSITARRNSRSRWQAFDERMKHYRHDRVYPTLPDWPVVCFYNMSKRRGEQRNWYALPFEDRRKLMLGHGCGRSAIRRAK